MASIVDERRHLGLAPRFLRKVFAFLEEERYKDAISWSDDGKQFTIHDVNRFTTDVLPEHFSHTNFSSFVRQLNSYGFRKVDQGSWSFANPGFFRGGLDNLKFIERKGLGVGRGRGRGSAHGYAGRGAYGHLGLMAGTPALGLNVGAGAMDGHLLQDPYRQDTFEATVTRELRLSRIEMANLMHRLTSVEKVQEQLLGILINQQTTMLNGASVTTAASSIPATSIPTSASTSTSLPASVFSALTGAAAAMAAIGGVHGSIGPSGINVRGGGVLPAQLQQHLNQQQAQQLHLNQQQAQQLQQLQQLQSQQQLDLGGITIREAPLMQSQAAAPLAPKPELAPAPPVKPNDPASQPLANISGLSGAPHLAGVNPLLGLGVDPGGGGGGGTGLAGGGLASGGGLATAAGLNLGGLGSGLAGQPGLLYPRQP